MPPQHPPKRISTPEELEELRARLGVRPDWHEPDEQEVSGVLHGTALDTAGYWPNESADGHCATITELYVTLQHQGQPVAYVNAALLLQWGCALGALQRDRAGGR